MQTEQMRFSELSALSSSTDFSLSHSADLVLLFGHREWIKNPEVFSQVKKKYPNAKIMGCSTAGEIFNTEVTDDHLVITAIDFEHTEVKIASATINAMEDSFSIGTQLAKELNPENLTHAFVLSEGLNVNGSDLVRGITQSLPKGVTVTGGLSGDGGSFEETWVIADSAGETNKVALLGLYGDRLKIGYGSVGGWDPFGPERIITKSESNILYELDHQSALDLYKNYLGEYANDLPASGLLFPLSVLLEENGSWIVRTILAVDEDKKTMTFAGEVPQGARARLMKANFERLIDGAGQAAETSYQNIQGSNADLAILISCVGRKMILKQRIEEEVEGVQEILGKQTCLTGFYSYGEISPFTPNAKCELHNQTMTITTLSEQ